jgi:hypothetical protein
MNAKTEAVVRASGPFYLDTKIDFDPMDIGGQNVHTG